MRVEIEDVVRSEFEVVDSNAVGVEQRGEWLEDVGSRAMQVGVVDGDVVHDRDGRGDENPAPFRQQRSTRL
jgi:hypothetical protein